MARTTRSGQKLWKSFTMRNFRRMSASCRDCVVGDNNTVVSPDTAGPSLLLINAGGQVWAYRYDKGMIRTRTQACPD